MSGKPHLVRVFVCYRRTDGSSAADTLHRLLQDRQYRDASGRLCQLSIYFDRAAPGVADWQRQHFPSLQASHALILIGTPGIAVDFSEHGKPDWVYKELQWWIKHRKTSPIVIDTTAEGDRWLPKFVKAKWPNLNRLDFPAGLEVQKPDSEPAERLRERIIRTIIESENATVFEDVERLQRLTGRLKTALAIGSALLVTSIALGGWAILSAQQRKAAEEQALEQARVAQRMKAATLETLEWVVSKAARLEFDRSRIPERTQEILDGVAIRLEQAGFVGEMVLSADPGDYCFSEDMEELLAAELPVSQCHFRSRQYGMSLSSMLANSVENYVRDYYAKKGATDNTIVIRPKGVEEPAYAYPCRESSAETACSTTAGEWNEAAALNNGVRLELVEPARTPERTAPTRATPE